MHIKNILNDMEKDNIQAYLLTQFTNVEYISNYKPTSFAFCVIKENPIIYASQMDMEIANRDSSIEVKQYEKFETITINFNTCEKLKSVVFPKNITYVILGRERSMSSSGCDPGIFYFIMTLFYKDSRIECGNDICF